MKNFNVIRVYDSDYIPQYDINNEIPTACNEKRLTYLLNKKKLHRNVKKIENIRIKRIFFILNYTPKED